MAAGRGERMRPLSDTCPKPLLKVGGKSLIVWQIERLAQAGFGHIVINHAHLGQMIEDALGDGSAFGVRLSYSPEAKALETLGGIVQARPWLGDMPFAVVSSDIYTDFPYDRLHAAIERIAQDPQKECVHLVVVENPSWYPKGDMGLQDGLIAPEAPQRWTYGNIAVYHPSLFDGFERGLPGRLFPWTYDFARAGRVTGELYRGVWDNIGTPTQLAQLDQTLRASNSSSI